MLFENDEQQVLAQNEVLGDVLVSVTGIFFNQLLQMCVKLLPGEQIPVDDLIWVILEGDPRSCPSEEGQRIGQTLKGGSPRAIKDDVRICLILDCCRCHFAMIHLIFTMIFTCID